MWCINRVSSKSQVFPANAVADMITNLMLYHLIHPDNVEILSMFVTGSFWTHGLVIDDTNAVVVRVAPPAPPVQTDQDTQTEFITAAAVVATLPKPKHLSHTHAPHTDLYTTDLHLKLVGLDHTISVFMSVGVSEMRDHQYSRCRPWHIIKLKWTPRPFVK